MKKKAIIIIVILLIILAGIGAILLQNENNGITLKGWWTSTRDSLIRVIKEYKDGQPVYANENVVEYWLDLKKDGSYILYFNEVADKSRSNYNIEKNLLEKGKYNFSIQIKEYDLISEDLLEYNETEDFLNKNKEELCL